MTYIREAIVMVIVLVLLVVFLVIELWRSWRARRADQQLEAEQLLQRGTGSNRPDKREKCYVINATDGSNTFRDCLVSVRHDCACSVCRDWRARQLYGGKPPQDVQ